MILCIYIYIYITYIYMCVIYTYIYTIFPQPAWNTKGVPTTTTVPFKGSMGRRVMSEEGKPERFEKNIMIASLLFRGWGCQMASVLEVEGMEPKHAHNIKPSLGRWRMLFHQRHHGIHNVRHSWYTGSNDDGRSETCSRAEH